jgi:two-component system response regulator FixJ
MRHPAIVHLVDDDDAIRRSLALLARSAGHEARAYESGEALLAAVTRDSAGCVVTDVRMPGMNGLELQEALRTREIDLPVIVITGHGDVPMAVRALKQGAIDFIEKPFDERVFLDSIAEALAVNAKSAGRRGARADVEARVALLTLREREIMGLVVQGMSNHVAADTLNISVRTVENHRARVMEKMGARGLSDLVRMVLKLEDA